MAKTKISEFSSTPANNTDIDSINIAEGCAPSNINDAIRELMAQLKDFQIGSQGDSFNGPIGTTTAAAGAFTTLSASSTLSVTGAGSIQGLTVGRGAGAVATNTAVGASALAANTTGVQQTVVGASAGASITTNSSLSALGYQAAYYMTDSNDAFGRQALYGQSGATGYYNCGFGIRALYALTTGNTNVAIGTFSLQANTTGSSNFAGGYQSLFANTTASNNTAVGYQAMYQNTTGANNTTLGYWAGFGSTSGANNVWVGYAAGPNNGTASANTGSNNVGVGYQALNFNTTASGNTALGYQAAYTNTTGNELVAVGFESLKANTTGYSNTAVGHQASALNTTGASNVAMGRAALYPNTTGSNNTAIGYYALVSNTTGTNNTAIGKEAGYTNSTGSQNAFLGRYSGYYTTGGFNTFVGDNAGSNISSGTKNTVLGRYDGNQGGLDIRTASNNIVLSDGDGSLRAYYLDSASSWYMPPVYASTSGLSANVVVQSTGQLQRATSSLKYKKNVQDATHGLAEVLKLRSVTYNSNNENETQTYGGLIAEEVHAAGLTEFVQYTPDGTPDALGYGNMVSVLVKAIQELKAEFDAYKASHP